MNMWQPIETAPKDQAFLAVLTCAGEQTICTMRWAVVEAKNSRPDHDVFHVERVTHWMPLPALPGAQPAPQDWIERGLAELDAIRNRHDDDELLDDRTLIARIGNAILPGAQPAPSEEARLVSYHPDGETCTLNINGVEMYYDRVDRDTQPAPSVPVDLIADYLVSISAHVAHQDDPKAQAEIGELLRMLAAAPEVKP